MTQSPPTRPDAGSAEALGLSLPRSGDPAVVLTGLADACVPAICDGCAVELTVDGVRRHIAHPASALAGAVPPSTGETTVRVSFADVVGSTYAGTASFAWRGRTPTASDRSAVALLVECAVRTVAWHRTEQGRRAAETRIENLEQALASSRDIAMAIGIVMTTHKVSADVAIAALQKASQRANRKLRLLALDVIDTGWLDPAVTAVEQPSTL